MLASVALTHLDRLPAQICAVEPEQVEGVEERPALFLSPSQLREDRQAVLVAAHGLAVDKARADLEVVHRLDDEREARGPVIAAAGNQPAAVAFFARALPAN